jgi:SAM-dependent methyltransferase
MLGGACAAVFAAQMEAGAMLRQGGTGREDRSSMVRETHGPQGQEKQAYWPHYELEPRFLVPIVGEMFGGRVLAKALWRKVVRRLLGYRGGFQPAAIYNRLVVFDRPGLNGGGSTHGQNMPRVLLELGLKRCARLFEFCAGPGYIGYNLLANGFCERLVLSDINPEAVKAAEYTAKRNRVEHLVKIYLSDGLDQIPADERWDLVVANPPASAHPVESELDLIACDADWALHRRFYGSVKKFMKPGGHAVMAEHRGQSTPEVFEPMIRAGGGRLVATLPGRNLQGEEFEKYYIMSEW